MITATALPFHASPTPPSTPERAPALDMEAFAGEAGDDFEALRELGRELIAKGAYQEAAATYRRAADAATSAGDAERADEALCGWGAAETELGNGAQVMPKLREILLGSKDDHNCCLAAYTLARAHELQGQTRKALFYAQLFRNRAEYVDRSGLLGLAHNLLGNLLAAEGRDTEAIASYRRALRLSKDAPEYWRASAEGNLGYCLLASATAASGLRRARCHEGLTLIYRSLRIFRRIQADADIALAHLDLCFAHLALKRFASAERHGTRALDLGERCQKPDIVKNSLYLLGQIFVSTGHEAEAHRFLGELERRFYPGQIGLADRLISVDLLQVVNLRA